MVQAVHHHRPTLKQQNKPFKSKHATKSALKERAKGRTQRSNLKSPAVSTAAQARLNRRNTQKQVQAAKRAALIESTRIFNGVDGAPRIVAVIPLCEDVRIADAVRALATSISEDVDSIDDASPLWKIKAHRFKSSLQFIPVRYGRPWEALDAAKAADYVLCLLSPTIEVPEIGDTLLRMLQAQGLPTVVSAIPPDPSTSSIDPKSRTAILKSLLSFMQYFDPSQGRVYDLSSPSDSLSALRSLAEGRPGEVRWRSGRAWVVSESTEWEDGFLKVTGVVRGNRLGANRLVHLPNFGDYPVNRIMSAVTTRSKPHNKMAVMDIEPQVLSERVPSTADSMISTNVPDDMANEQTWPTEEEMAAAVTREEVMEDFDVPDAKKGTTPKRIKRIPKGMSEYQASWIVEESDNEDGDGDEEAPQDNVVAEEEEVVPIEDAMELESEKKSTVEFQDLDAEEEERQLRDWRNRAQEERDAQEFPDEIDTPRDVPASTRFARYRGMRSLRTSPWDPYENLPKEYARLFEFEEFRRTERNVTRAAEAEGVEPGTRVTVYVEGVPGEACDSNRLPIVLYGLLKHEHKKTVLHFTVQRNTEYTGSVKSKDPLMLCYGPRRLRVNPVYSQHTRGGGKGVNNVHKFEHFLWHGVTAVASVYAPVIFGKQPCALLRETDKADAPKKPAPVLVATGAFLNPDTTRIIAKRVVLSGHPFRVHRASATVRYMFFSPDDVAYFKPVQLQTKHGRTGHIRESLGTHGYFKARFDGPVSQMDTVCMALYKRVYPRWSEMWKVPAEGSGRDGSGDVVMED